MSDLSWDDVRKGDWIVVTQDVPQAGPRVSYHITWAGQVMEHSPKWTRLKAGGKELTMPTQWGNETITRYTKKEFDKWWKTNVSA